MSRFNDPQLLLTFASFHLLACYVVAAAIALCRWPKLWLHLLATFLGLLTSFVDLHTNEPQLPALLLLASTFFVSAAQSRRAWQWALLVGIWVPVASIVRGAAGFGISLHTLTSLIALIPAFLGAYVGVLVARIGNRIDNSTTAVVSPL